MDLRTLELLRVVKPMVTAQTYKTIKGQIKAGDEAGAVKGMERILEKEGARSVVR